MVNPVKSYQRRIHGKLVTVSPYSRKDPSGRAGVGGPNPKTRTAKQSAAKPKSASSNYQSPEWMKAQVRDLTKFKPGSKELNSALASIVQSPKLGGIVVFPSPEALEYALQFAESKGLHEVWGVPIRKLFVLAKDEPKARELLYDALKKVAAKRKTQLKKKVDKITK